MEWTNWSGRQKSSPLRSVEPTSQADLVAAVTAARSDGLALRAMGTAHSHSRVAATDGVLVNMDSWQGVVEADITTRSARIRAGSKIFSLGDQLRVHGLALRNQGDIDKQSIAGATATGTHGTGPSLANLSSSIEAVRVVLSSGDIVDCSRTDEPDLFEIARHSLGGVGLITELTLGLRGAYRLHERLWLESPDEVFGRVDELIGATRHFEFFWIPERDACACKSLTETDAAPDELGDNKYERIGWSYDIISSIRDVKHTEMEYSVPAEHGPACFLEVREMVKRDFPELTWPLEYRTVAPDDIWISAARGRDTVTISVHQDIAVDDRPLFEACEAIFRNYQGRPHWGKVHYQSAAELGALHPRWADWWQARDRYDPDATFVTSDLALLRP